MDSALVARPPFYQIPIVFSFKSAERISVWRDIHCPECGRVAFRAKDAIVSISDGDGGSLGIQCPWHYCKQRLVLERTGE